MRSRCAHCTMWLPERPLISKSFNVLSTQPTTVPLAPSRPSETSVLLLRLIPRSSESLWCLIPPWLCPPSVRCSLHHEYPKGLFPSQDYPVFQTHWGQFFSHKTCSLDLLLSCFISFIFLYSCVSLSLLSLSLWVFTKHTDPPSWTVHLLLFKHAHQDEHTTSTQAHLQLRAASIPEFQYFWCFLFTTKGNISLR